MLNHPWWRTIFKITCRKCWGSKHFPWNRKLPTFTFITVFKVAIPNTLQLLYSFSINFTSLLLLFGGGSPSGFQRLFLVLCYHSWQCSGNDMGCQGLNMRKGNTPLIILKLKPLNFTSFKGNSEKNLNLHKMTEQKG